MERVITTACEGVFKHVVRAREIETLLNGARIAAARGFSQTSSSRDVMTDLDHDPAFYSIAALPLHASALLKSDLLDRRRHACFIASSGLGEVRFVGGGALFGDSTLLISFQIAFFR